MVYKELENKMIRMRNTITPLLDRYQDAWNQAMLPADGQILAKSEMVTKYYKVSHEEDGTIKYNPITKEEAMNDSNE
jgi:hypothetical protein